MDSISCMALLLSTDRYQLKEGLFYGTNFSFTARYQTIRKKFKYIERYQLHISKGKFYGVIGASGSR